MDRRWPGTRHMIETQLVLARCGRLKSSLLAKMGVWLSNLVNLQSCIKLCVCIIVLPELLLSCRPLPQPGHFSTIHRIVCILIRGGFPYAPKQV
jgi:hypothetical protein